jgi:hypothetical protein
MEGPVLVLCRVYRGWLASSSICLIPQRPMHSVFHSRRDLLPTFLIRFVRCASVGLPAGKLQSALPWYLLKAY